MTTSQRSPRVPGQTILCGWCLGPVKVQPVGRLPKWCSATCRHRAWEQRRAAASDRRPVDVVDRVIEVQVPKLIHVIERVTIETLPSGRRWAKHLEELVAQVQAGRVYDRDLPDLARALDIISKAIEQRPGWSQFLRRQARAQQRHSVYTRR